MRRGRVGTRGSLETRDMHDAFLWLVHMRVLSPHIGYILLLRTSLYRNADAEDEEEFRGLGRKISIDRT